MYINNKYISFSYYIRLFYSLLQILLKSKISFISFFLAYCKVKKWEINKFMHMIEIILFL